LSVRKTQKSPALSRPGECDGSSVEWTYVISTN